MEIKKINNQDPFTYIQNFFGLFLKDEHAQFSFNLKYISLGVFPYSFNPENYKNITIEFIDNSGIIYNYIIIYPEEETNEYKSFFNKEIYNYLQNSVKIPNLFEIEKKFNFKYKNEQSNSNSFWDINHEDSLKFRVDNENQVNVIYQSSFHLNKSQTIEIFGKIMEEMSKNDYPIIVIESLNGGGYVDLATMFEKVLNFNTSKTKVKVSFGVQNKELTEVLSDLPLYNTETCEIENILKSKTYIDDLGNDMKHYRTGFYLISNSNTTIEQPLKKYKHKMRKPTDIIIFTDSFSFSATSIFIKDIQESGNGIIVGYNGIPSKEKKNEKFSGSQSSTMVLTQLYSLISNKNIKKLKDAYCLLSIPYSPIYNDDYQNNSPFKIPREYTIEKIDERSNIYGLYNDERYLEFVNEGKRIIKKYLNECNPDNLNLLLKNDNCTFENDIFAHGGFECGKNGKWTNICKPYYCDYGYYFDNYEKKCKADNCFFIERKNNKNDTKDNNTENTNNNKQFIYYIIIGIVLFIFIFICFIIILKTKNRSKINELIGEPSINELIDAPGPLVL